MMAELRNNLRPLVEAVDSGLLSGAVCVVGQGDKLVQQNVIGYRNLEMQYPMQADTVFRVMSMSKPVTSVGCVDVAR